MNQTMEIKTLMERPFSQTTLLKHPTMMDSSTLGKDSYRHASH